MHLLAVASPGPSTVLVIQTAAVAGRRGGLLAAFAMMVGAMIWAVAALFGLQALFAHFDWLYVAFRIAGALYLIYLAVMLWRHAGDPLPDVTVTGKRLTGWQGFFRALLLQLSNPKIMVFFGSIFLSLLPPGLPAWMDGAVLRSSASTNSAGSRCWRCCFPAGRRVPSMAASSVGSTASWAVCSRCSACGWSCPTTKPKLAP